MEVRGDGAGIEIERTSEEVTLVLKAEGKRRERLGVDATFEMTTSAARRSWRRASRSGR